MAYLPEVDFYNKPSPYAGARPEFGAIRSSKQKYKRGETPCHNCTQGDHKMCRPRLDNQLCSCSCRHAAAYRTQAAAMMADNEDLSVVDCVRQIAPKMRKSYVGDECYYPVDRSKDDPLQDS